MIKDPIKGAKQTQVLLFYYQHQKQKLILHGACQGPCIPLFMMSYKTQMESKGLREVKELEAEGIWPAEQKKKNTAEGSTA